MDHWSKFHVLFALQRKSSKEVAWNLATKVFAYLGLPKILQSDNGREFTSTLIAILVRNWPGEVTIVNGRPRHPQKPRTRRKRQCEGGRNDGLSFS